MADMGMDAYRFSIAWSRIFPGSVFLFYIDCYATISIRFIPSLRNIISPIKKIEEIVSKFLYLNILDSPIFKW
jgi:hypothetical protein